MLDLGEAGGAGEDVADGVLDLLAAAPARSAYDVPISWDTGRPRIVVIAELARTSWPASVTVAIPIAATSKTSRNRSRCSRRTASSAAVLSSGASAGAASPGRSGAGPGVGAGSSAVNDAGSGGPPLWGPAPSRTASSWPGSARNEVDFSRNADAPSSSARSASPCSANPLYITTRVSGEDSKICGSASRPSICGMETSSSMRSGRWARAASTASRPVAPSPTTSMRPESRSRMRTSRRTSSASSTMTILGRRVPRGSAAACRSPLRSVT